ncbi:MAG: hypothetical protein EA353_13625 [Puniceicoccaceae bacterium]|nr:MAG: hypothetical protein EA353_13625 [Puniceicoccaceae bacterium]
MQSLLTALNYLESESFLSAEEAGRLGHLPFGHLCRKLGEKFAFQGVYTLKQPESRLPTPVVAVFEARDEVEARKIHRLVWNQDFVPFILIQSPRTIRLFSGFQLDNAHDGEGIIAPLTDFSQIHEVLRGLHASEIDDGSVWALWGKHIKPDQRIDWHLLDSLNKLNFRLQNEGLASEVAHALIGRFVYLRYLLDRGFLSDRKLRKWNLIKQAVFSRDAKLSAFVQLNQKLDDATEGLNGSIFPFPASSIRAQYLKTVAAAFSGDDPETGQMALDFGVYDFSYIPIETLSVIYEQFLHEPAADGAQSRGRKQGAYYTPIPLVNYMLAEMDACKPLGPGIKILDPSCGSGVFLVQAYRLLIERAIRASERPALPPSELRSILQAQIFGVDRDPDACRIAEMSLLLTLLDYVSPPDLEGKEHKFHLPKLNNENIFEADFFDPQGTWEMSPRGGQGSDNFDWVVGNPPWKDLKNPPKDPADLHALNWMLHLNAPPTGGNQLAEAFVWKSREFLKPGGQASLVLPAMTLFKSESENFRKALFSEVEVETIVNYSNLCYVLFAGRANVPAMTLRFREPDANEVKAHDTIQTFAPFVINQEANRPVKANKQLDTWTITVNASEIQEIPRHEAQRGKALTWKVAMWGCQRDARLLETLSRRFSSLSKLEDDGLITLSQGLELRNPSKTKEKLEPLPEVVDELELLFDKLKGCGRIVHFPDHATRRVPESRGWVRKGRGKLPLAVSRPPHLIVDASRRFAVFSNQFIAVPPRKIGIASTHSKGSEILRALALILNSDYLLYHQFFESSEWGIQRSISTLQTLKRLPLPDLESVADQWANWHSEMEHRYEPGETLSATDQETINTMVFDALKLRPQERVQIQDFVSANLLMVQGKVERDAVCSPTEDKITTYLNTLRNQLDNFMANESHPASHHLTMTAEYASSMIEIVLREGPPAEPQIRAAEAGEAQALREAWSRLLDKQRQWIYFNRNLRIYRDGRLYLFKPMQAMHWTARQAILDADELIAEALDAGGGATNE